MRKRRIRQTPVSFISAGDAHFLRLSAPFPLFDLSPGAPLLRGVGSRAEICSLFLSPATRRMVRFFARPRLTDDRYLLLTMETRASSEAGVNCFGLLFAFCECREALRSSPALPEKTFTICRSFITRAACPKRNLFVYRKAIQRTRENRSSVECGEEIDL